MNLKRLKQEIEALDDDLEVVIYSGRQFYEIEDVDSNSIQVEITPKGSPIGFLEED